MSGPIDYDAWADEYYNDFLRVVDAINRINDILKNNRINASYREELKVKRKQYREIRNELEKSVIHLRTRAASISKKEYVPVRLIKNAKPYSDSHITKLQRVDEFLNGSGWDIYSYVRFMSNGNSNEKDIERMRSIVEKLIPTALTERQQECIHLFFTEGLTIQDISKKLKISPTTASRCVKASINKLQKKAIVIMNEGKIDMPEKDFLTLKQRKCYDMYADGIPQAKIAKTLGLSTSTVSRHIKAAKSKLEYIKNISSTCDSRQDYDEIELMLSQI